MGPADLFALLQHKAVIMKNPTNKFKIPPGCGSQI